MVCDFCAVLDEAARCVAGPSPYEVWRDAVFVAAQRTPRDHDSSFNDAVDVEYEARQYAEILANLGQAPPLVDAEITEPEVDEVASPVPRQARALDLIRQFGAYDGEHHKQWVLDQVARILTADADRYDTWRPEGWDEGIAP